MASNVVTVSGMFGDGKTYFADSPVVIDISGLYWGDTVTSPFTVVRVEVIYPVASSSAQTKSGSASRAPSVSYSSGDATQQLAEMFPNSNAVFYDESIGYINGAVIKQVTDSNNITHNMLVVTSYTDLSLIGIDDEEGDLSIYDAETIMSYDDATGKYIVELDSTQERCDTLLELCSIAYGDGQSGSGGDGISVSDDDVQVVGEFRADTGGQTSISFDISSALSAIWSDYDFSATDAEVPKANGVLSGSTAKQALRDMREYALRIYTEYLSSDDGGVFATTQCVDKYGNTLIPGGQCLIGGFTEWERYTIGAKENADVSSLEHTNPRNGDASTKPTSSPEKVGRSSITSWVDVQEGFAKSIFYPASYNNGQGQPDDSMEASGGWAGHAPLVLRDSQDYIDFLFVNRRGAVETCSGLTKEAMNIDVESKTYTRVERPAFIPSRSIMAIASGGRRSWPMSSGYVTREWAEWWTLEFLKGRRHWMLYQGRYVPVTIEPAKKSVSIYDRSKQQPPHVDFTVTLALEG